MENKTPRKMGRVSLRQQVLLAAIDCSGGDLTNSFTAEGSASGCLEKGSFCLGAAGGPG